VHESDDKFVFQLCAYLANFPLFFRTKENNARLTKQLEEEKRSLKAVQENLKFELNSQTELERIIRGCMDDVRKEIARRSCLPDIVGSVAMLILAML
jgi:hypothetical protein